MENQETLESTSVHNENENNQEDQTIDFLEDPPSEMTYGRRIALWLMQYKWYNPQPKRQEVQESKDGTEDNLVEPLLENQSKDEDEEIAESRELPSLEKAWAFFEHVTLPRYIYRPEDGEYPKKLDRAQPGENAFKTKLYSPLWTPIDQMGDFGIGIGMYFSALKSAIILLFIAGIFSIPNIVYYASKSYSDNEQEGVEGYLQGTAICTDTTWVPCPTCSSDDFKGADYRLTTENGIQYALKNNCKSPPLSMGLMSLFTLSVIGIGFIVIKVRQEKTLVRMDEDEQTATDYSIHIHNPPDDATNPDEWKDFLETNFGKVAVVTICINNDKLVRALVKRRECLLQISRLIRKSDFTDEEIEVLANEQHLKNSQRWCLCRCFQKYVLYPIGILDIAVLQARYEKLNYDIRQIVLYSGDEGASELPIQSPIESVAPTNLNPFPVSNVFVTFETEEAQRKSLYALSCGTIHAVLNNTYAFPNKDHLFRKEQILLVGEPEEPSTIRWQHLNMTFFGRLRILTSTLFTTLLAIALLAFIIKLLHDRSSLYSAYAIAAFNQIFPQFCMALTRTEPHKSAGDKQTSLFFKIALFRWVNTVMVIDFLTPFTNRLSDSSVTGDHAALIPSVFAIFKADVLVMILLQLSDPIGMFNRHFKAPRAYDQDAMYKNFKGNNWRLAERYTNMSKVLFLSFYYCTIFPSALFLCAGNMLVLYYIDSYSIMRIWKRNPQIGPQIAHFNDKYIVPFYILVLSIFSSYWWSAFPYDNLCSVDSTSIPTQAPTYISITDDNLFPPGYDSFSESEFNNKTVYEYCNQNLLFKEFPAKEHTSWMTEDQRHMAKLFHWSSAVVLILMIVFFFFLALRHILSFFKSDYSPDGSDMEMPFSTLEDNCTYVPQVETKQTPFPFIVGDVTGMNPELFDWVSAEHSHDYYNVTLDLKDILTPAELEETSSKALFSIVKSYTDGVDIDNDGGSHSIAENPDMNSPVTPDVDVSQDTLKVVDSTEDPDTAIASSGSADIISSVKVSDSKIHGTTFSPNASTGAPSEDTTDNTPFTEIGDVGAPVESIDDVASTDIRELASSETASGAISTDPPNVNTSL